MGKVRIEYKVEAVESIGLEKLREQLRVISIC